MIIREQRFQSTKWALGHNPHKRLDRRRNVSVSCGKTKKIYIEEDITILESDLETQYTWHDKVNYHWYKTKHCPGHVNHLYLQGT